MVEPVRQRTKPSSKPNTNIHSNARVDSSISVQRLGFGRAHRCCLSSSGSAVCCRARKGGDREHRSGD